MKEIWKDINGYEGLYQVSNLGNIKSLLANKIIKPCPQSCGYRKVELYNNHSSKIFYVHRLVALHFVPNPESKPHVNHIDGVKTNNKASNLEWVTAKENQQHAIKIGLRISSPMKGRFGKDHPSSKPINQYDLNGNFIRSWDSIADASRFYQCESSVISNCVNGRHKTSQGYIWKAK